jgi:streptomycin 6-kinase
MLEDTRAVPASLVLKGAAITGDAGHEWRRRLPATVTGLVERWSLAIEAPFPGLTYNYVAPVTRADGTPAVLKLWFPFQREFEAEAETLRIYDGNGAVRLLEVDVEQRAMLLERAEPGTDVWQVEDEDRQIAIVASTMKRLWRTPPLGCTLPLARSYYERMVETAPKLATNGFPLDRVFSAKAIFDALEVDAPPAVLHEDLHQANIIAAEREPWLAIDPHGLVGPPVIDTTQMILNVIWRANASDWPRIAARYVDALSEALGLDREQVALCGIARSVLEAFWTLEDKGDGWERDIAVADAFEATLQHTQ